MVAISLSSPSPRTAPPSENASTGLVVPLERDFAKVPHAVSNRTQRKEGGGYVLSARAVGLYAEIRKHCHRQQSKLGGLSCEVSTERLARAIGVEVRRTRQLVRQLEEQGVITVRVGEGFRGVNVFGIVLPVPQGLPAAPKPRRTPAIPCTDVPRQENAGDVRRSGFEVRGVSDFHNPTPGAVAGPPARELSAPVPGAPFAPAPAARATKRAGGGVIARDVPAGAWLTTSSDWQSVLGRQLRTDLPGLPPDVVAYAADELRAALADAALGGEPVRNRYRYALHVARKRWAEIRAEAGRAFSSSSARPKTSEPARPCEDTSAVASTEASKIDTAEPCKHGKRPDERCTVCDDASKDAACAFLRAGQRAAALGRLQSGSCRVVQLHDASRRD